MRKFLYTCLLLVVIMISFLFGMAYGKGLFNQNTLTSININNDDTLVGVYKTESWNGKIGTLALYEDYTCQYPTGDNATWETDGKTVYITVRDFSIHEAKIMESGLMLHETFFAKVSN